jgi:uncharacterized membrane protein
MKLLKQHPGQEERRIGKSIYLPFSTGALLVISSLTAFAMLGYRVFATGTFYYFFLLWNLFLAWLPYLISILFKKRHSFLENRWKTIALFASWLVLLPNCPYLLTDLVHLRVREFIPLWFDALLIVVFAWTGLLLGLKSISNVHGYLRSMFPVFISRIMLGFIILSCSFGVYVGRILRWNSWDFIIRPVPLAKSILAQFLHPFHHQQSFGMTLAFSLFLTVSYYTLLVFSGSMSKQGKD